MEVSCQRCHEPLHEGDRYCAACGLPQLVYVAAEAPVVPLGSDSVPPPLGEMAAVMNGLDWRIVLTVSLMLAVPAGVLCSRVSVIGPAFAFVWMVGAAVWAVSWYSRRSRTRRISAWNGARIGLVTGLLASWLAFALDGLQLWLGRFVWNQGQEMDRAWNEQMNFLHDFNLRLYGQMAATHPEVMQSIQSQQQWVLSQDGRAGAPVLFFVTGTVFLLAFAMIGGAVRARSMSVPRRSGVQS